VTWTRQCYLPGVHESLRVLDVLSWEADGPQSQTLEEVWQHYQRERSSGASPFAAAVLAASRTDRLGFAFAAGYAAALEHLVGGASLPAALCVSEVGGNGPRAIETRLVTRESGYRLTGEKTFVTFGRHANSLIVAARAGDKADGTPDLKVVKIPAKRHGVALQDLPEIAFVPEVPHASARFEQVEVHDEEILPGDGYLRYVKPFRTIEDIHVVGATLGYLIGWARRVGGCLDWIAELSANLVSLDALRALEPLDPRTHMALHGCHARTMQALTSDSFRQLLESANAAERDRWNRDRALLDVASKARARRFEAAAKALGIR
jgi:acyl-CoA dehydrogenase